MNNIYYPVIFFRDCDGYSCRVPDLPGSFSCGDSLDEAVESVTDAIGLYLDRNDNQPTPSDPQLLTLEHGEFIILVAFDKIAYAKSTTLNRSRKILPFRLS